MCDRRPSPAQNDGLACLAAVMLAFGAATDAPAQDCRPMATATYTDCSIGEARISGQQSEIAGSKARLRMSEERLRAVTGGVYAPKARKINPHHKSTAKGLYQKSP